MMQSIIDQVKELVDRINTIDASLDPEKAGRTKVLNQAVENAGDLPAQREADLHTFLAGLSEAEMIGVVVHLQRVIRKEYASKIDSFVEANVVEVEELPEAEQAALSEERKQLVEQAKAAHNYLKSFGVDEASLPKVPQAKRGRGKGSAMGARLSGTFNWAIDGTPVTGSKLGDLQKALKADSVADVRAAIEAAHGEGFDWKNPPHTIEFGITVGENNFSVKGVLAQDDTDVEDDSDSNEPDTDDDDFSFDDEDED